MSVFGVTNRANCSWLASFSCLFALLFSFGVLSESFSDTANIYYQKDPSLVIKALLKLDAQSYQHLEPETLVKASYAAATTAHLELALTLTDILLIKAAATENELLKGKAHYNRGAAFAYAGNHDLALDSLLLSLASFENSQNEKEIARIKGALALIYVEIGEHELAKPYFEEALASHELRNDSANIAMVLQNRAFMKIENSQYDSAKTDLLRALKLSEGLGIKAIFPVIYKNLGKIETALGNSQKALEYFEKAINESQISDLEHLQAVIFREFARLRFSQGYFVEAKSILRRSINIGKKYTLLKQMRNSYLLLAEITASQNEYKEAFLAQEQASQILEKMGNSNIAANLSRLERYTTSLKEQNKRLVLEKEKKIATLAAEREYLLRNFSIAVAGIALLLAIYFIHRFTLSKKRADSFEKQSKIDALTGVWNRRAGEAQLIRLCSRDSISLKVFSIAMLDIDHFKRVNDQFGHDVGDRVIMSICSLIQDNLRPADMLCRWGGEEFIIILDDYDSTKAYDICERIRAKIETARIEKIGNMSVSIGISMFENDDIFELLKRGDQALYHAKHLGRNRVVVKNKSNTNLIEKSY
ncbi:tetratricopeptide repeat-containing diguanylate cyclase [Aliikangiella sp. IMCC44359]|uniref:tetratricopeptide repeat-containing diguanylate cyclase n=1 Tax=Aliikangiella sp. IMCC44359 TaxID=3459125 RepID=UPI00403AA054